MLKSIRTPDLSAPEVDRIYAALRAGIDPGQVTSEVAARHRENAVVARSLVDLALARLWLTEGAPVADVLTMLECRHRFELLSAACRAYAVEILWAAQQQMEAPEDHPKPTPKETKYAVA